MNRLRRWICISALVASTSVAGVAEAPFIPAQTVEGNLNEAARIDALHAEMKRECGTSPGSTRCHRLKRALRTEARNRQKNLRK